MSGGAVAGGIAVGIAFIVMLSVIPIPKEFRGNIDDVVITMERTPCFGACPAYHLTVFGNGTVVYDGFSSVAVTGKQTSQISQEKVRELINEFYEAGFFTLRDSYVEDVTDLPSTTTSISIRDETKSVYRYGFGPERLVQLEDRIDEITEANKWIKQ